MTDDPHAAEIARMTAEHARRLAVFAKLRDVTEDHAATLNAHDSVYRSPRGRLVKVKQIEIPGPHGTFTIRVSAAPCAKVKGGAVKAQAYAGDPLVVAWEDVGVAHDTEETLEDHLQAAIARAVERVDVAMSHHRQRKALKRVLLTEHPEWAETPIIGVRAR